MCSSSWCHGIPSTVGTIGSLARSWLDVEGHIDIALLDDEDLSSEVSGLCLLGGWQLSDVCANQEDIGEVVQLALGDVGLLEDISTKSQIPALVCPVCITTEN